MGYITGTPGETKFSWYEYQVLMLVQAAMVCASIFFVEMTIKNFQVLPLLFPGMFRVHERRFYFFNHDVSDSSSGKKVRGEAKMILRLTLIGVLSYLWHHCLIETTQQVGKGFPEEQCKNGHDCFASDFSFVTFFNRNQVGIDCDAKHEDFPHRMVVSCIRFVPPTASSWLMHFAISYSVTQLSFKAFELFVWIGGGSLRFRRFLMVMVFIGFSSFVVLYFGGVWTDFVSTWISFVMNLTIPLFLHSVYKSSILLERLFYEESERLHRNIEERLVDAFEDIADVVKGPLSDSEISPRRFITGSIIPRSSDRGSAIANQIRNKIQLLRGKKDAGCPKVEPTGSVVGKSDTGSEAQTTPSSSSRSHGSSPKAQGSERQSAEADKVQA